MAPTDGEVTISVTEQHNADHLPDLRRQLDDAVRSGAVRVVLDLSRVRRLSSSVLAELLYLHRRCRARGGHVEVRGGSRATLDLLHDNGLDRIFVVQDGSRPAPPPAPDA